MSEKRGPTVSFDRCRIRFRQHFRTGRHADLASSLYFQGRSEMEPLPGRSTLHGSRVQRYMFRNRALFEIIKPLIKRSSNLGGAEKMSFGSGMPQYPQ